MSGFTVPAFDFFYLGLPASGGSLNVYQTNTTTPVTIYSDGGLTTPISNPLTLDANGQAKFYYTGTVNLRLDAYTASGTLIQSIDPVYPTGAASGAGIAWVPAGGSADVITATYSPVITALTDGLLLGFRATAANATTTPTFSPNALTAHTITQKGGSALVAGNIAGVNAEYLVQYDLANTRWELLNPSGGAASGGVTTYSVVTDSTDISLSAVPTQTNVGSSFSATIPIKGTIYWNFAGEVIIGTGAASLVFGLRIGSTNYWPVSSPSGTPTYSITMGANGTGTFVMASTGIFGGVVGSSGMGTSGANGTQIAGISIEQSAIPTGTQTVQVIAGLLTAASGTITLKGTVVTSRVYLTIENHT